MRRGRNSKASDQTVGELKRTTNRSRSRELKNAQTLAADSIAIVHHTDYEVTRTEPVVMAMQRALGELAKEMALLQRRLPTLMGEADVRVAINELVRLNTLHQHMLSDVRALLEKHYREHVHVNAMSVSTHAAMLALQFQPSDDPELPSLPRSQVYDAAQTAYP